MHLVELRAKSLNKLPTETPIQSFGLDRKPLRRYGRADYRDDSKIFAATTKACGLRSGQIITHGVRKRSDKHDQNIIAQDTSHLPGTPLVFKIKICLNQTKKRVFNFSLKA